MKRNLLVNLLSIVVILFFWQAGFSQNHLANDDMGSWADANTPTGLTSVQGITQKTTIVLGGTYSARQISEANKLGQSIDIADANIGFTENVTGADPRSTTDIYVADEDAAIKKRVALFTVTNNRKLTWTEPKPGETYYVGDSVVFKWTSENVDSILIAGKGKRDNGYFFLTVKGNMDSDHPELAPVPAAQGYFGLRIPLNASVDTLTFYLFDAADTTFYTTVEPIYLKDTIPPTVRSLAPNPGSMDFPATAPVSVTFSEEIVAGTGQLHIKKSDGTTVEDFDVSKLEFRGDNFFVNPNPQLVPGQSYYIEMDAGLVKDPSGNEFAGLSGKSWSFTVATATLYFSEYIEGSSNNKALEVYNPTDHTVSLDNYMIAGTYNGSDFATDSASLYYFPKGAELKAGAVFVLANSGASSDILKVTDDTLAYNEGGYVCSFTGNDARVLIRKLNNSDWAWIDMIGNGGEDPGTGWNVAGVTAATKDHTLLRKVSVKMGTTSWGSSVGSNADDSQWIVEPKDYFDNIGLPTPADNDQTEITEFRILNLNHENITIKSVIDSQAATVNIEVLSGTDVTQLFADIQVSRGAEVHPDSSDMLDFTNPLLFTVTAENGTNKKVWTVTVTVASKASSEADITGFSVPDAMGSMIDDSSYTVFVIVPFGTSLTSLTPDITVSAGATVSPASGVAQDFTNPVVYTVTAQDGTTTVDWTVTIAVMKPSYVSIHDIQYTTDPSGESPYKGMDVRTSGIITAISISKGAQKGYFIEAAEAAWNGVYVYDPGNTSVAIGDSVEVIGTVDEYYNFTEIKALQDFKNLGSGYTRNPVAVATGDFANEKWEAVLVKFVNATCTNADMGHGEVEVNDGSGAAVLDDYLYQYDPFTLNDVYTVAGVANYSYSAFKLDPRDAGDITNVTGISNNTLAENISIYPNPGNSQLHINLNNSIKGEVRVKIMDLTGRVVYEHAFNHVMNQTLSVDISNEPSNLYFISISDANNTVVKKFLKR